MDKCKHFYKFKARQVRWGQNHYGGVSWSFVGKPAWLMHFACKFCGYAIVVDGPSLQNQLTGGSK